MSRGLGDVYKRQVEGETAHFSDNFFDLMPGETRTVRVASELSAKQLARRLKSMSLADTY